MAAGAIMAVAILAVGAYVLLVDNDDGSEPVSLIEGSSDWNYWLGNLSMPGVSDSKTPVSESDFNELWNVSGKLEGMVWKVPGSAICIGDYTYYYDGAVEKLKCVETRTGKRMMEKECPSDPVFNMPIAYGDGKIFVPCLSGGKVRVAAFDAETMDRLFFTEQISGGEVQGAIVYHDGRIFFGTYDGDFVCFSTADTDTSRSDEVITAAWKVSGNGWYNAVPAFAGNYCVVAEKGYGIGGTEIYVVDYRTGAIQDSYKIANEYCTSGLIQYDKDGRIYMATGMGDKTDKILVVRSFKITTSGSIDRSSFKTWISDIVKGGTQSTPVIYNDRLYIGGGGDTFGTQEPFHVLDIGSDGTMTEAYRVDIMTKGTAAVTNAYATPGNGFTVYIYLMQYDTPGTIYVLRDKSGQTSGDIVFQKTPSVVQYAFQSFSISPDGCLLIRNDSTIFCYGGSVRTASSGPSVSAMDVQESITRILALCELGHVNPLEVERAEMRFGQLSDSEKVDVDNYRDLQSLYRKVTVVSGDGNAVLTVPYGSVLNMTSPESPTGKILTGWSKNSEGTEEWCIWSDRVTADMTIYAVYKDLWTISFDSGGGSPEGPMGAVQGGKVGYLPTPSRDGYVFGGWYYGDVQLKQGDTFAYGSDVELKAKWLRIVTIQFDSGGGSSVSSVTAVYSKALGDLPVPSKERHTFEGWYHNGTLYTVGTTVDFESDITFTAHWIKNALNSLDLGGINVASDFSNDASATMNPLNPNGNTFNKLKDAAGADIDAKLISIVASGIYEGQDFKMSIKVSPSLEGRDCTVYYAYGGEIFSVSGTVISGKLDVTVKGDISLKGAEIVFAVVKGVLQIEVASVSLPSTMAVTLYTSSTLNATVMPSEVANTTLTWSSSDDSIASVDAEGKVTARKVGVVVITATADNGKYADCTVTVNMGSDYLLIDSSASATRMATLGLEDMDLGKALQNKSNSTVIWESSNEGVATVDQYGVVKITGAGTAVIKVMLSIDDTIYATCTIHVAEDMAFMIYVNDGEGWQSEISSGKNAYLALMNSSFSSGSMIHGNWLVENSNDAAADYGTISKLLGFENAEGMKWHVFVYIDNGSGFQWVAGIDAIGLYRPFDDYIKEYATANLALFYGTEEVAASQLSYLNSEEIVTVDLVTVEGESYKFTVTVVISPDYEDVVPDDFEMDDDWGAYAKAFVGYGSDLYRALLYVFGEDIEGEMSSLGFMGFVNSDLYEIWDFKEEGGLSIYLATYEGYDVSWPMGYSGPASPLGEDYRDIVIVVI